MSLQPLRFAFFGAGFWSQYQLAAWLDLDGVECVAVYNRTLSKAQDLAERFGIMRAYDDAEGLLHREQLDFVDVVTSVESHSQFVHLAARHGLPVICQKPMATSLAEAGAMVAVCQARQVPFYIHENWRWQRPLRELKRALDSGQIGSPFRARISYCSSFPVFENQPFLKELEQFIVADMGSHILDTARFLFGPVESLYCQTARVHASIRGEDVATLLLKTRSGVTVTLELSYASRTEKERFPETFVLIEGDQGSLELAPDYWIRETTSAGTLSQRCPPPHYPWADAAYDLVHASILDCNRNILGALRGDHPSETSAQDNLQTVRMVFAAYESARRNAVIAL